MWNLFFISLGVALWITAFDINYASMDQDTDRRQGIHSFPASYGLEATRKLSVALTIGWLVCFLLTGMHDFTDQRSLRYTLWVPSVVLMALINIIVMNSVTDKASHTVIIKMTIEVASLKRLIRALELMQQLPNVVSARRSIQS